MRQLGDICKLDGHSIPPVDVITGGSPCQDLSVAGRRIGLSGERSGLFREMVRVIKEMRDETGNRYPRYIIWENVKGAFTSNKGEDFREVLTQFAAIAEPDVSIPRPEGGKWSKAGCIMADDWSLAWRLHNSEYWGVPQARERIALVVDLGGQSAGEILFVEPSLHVDPEARDGERKGIAGAAQDDVDATGGSPIAYAIAGPGQFAYHRIGGYCAHVADISRTLDTRCGNGPLCNQGGMLVAQPIPINELNALRGMKSLVAGMGIGEEGQPQYALTTKHPGMLFDGYRVRRMTPLESERLQGFPDAWTDIGEWTDACGKQRDSSDSLRYKALGNSIALPFWQWLASRIREHLDGSDATLGSLFDGIGGFPLAFSREGFVPVWASEIDGFAMAVSSRHFPENS